MKTLKSVILYLIFQFVAFLAFCQQTTTVSGKITDSETSEPMPFVNVYFKGTEIGTSTDFDGFFKLNGISKNDTLEASYVGYKKKTIKIKLGTKQNINFQLAPDAKVIDEIIITDKYENPAWEILRKVIENKAKNSPEHLESYEHECYNRVEIDIDKISETMRQKKAMKKIISAMDSMEKMVGEDGKMILPIYVSEAISNVYYLKNPKKRYENVVKNKITGVGFDDGSIIAQLVAVFFQEYNFHENWLRVANKDIISPIADGWNGFYDYVLEDENPLIDNEYCHRISFKPKRAQDLAFTGTIWISHKNHALRRIDVTLGQEANLNYIDKIKIQQELIPVGEGNTGYFPSKTRVLIDIAELGDSWAGMLAKFYTSNKNFVVNKPKNPDFYINNRVIAEDAYVNPSNFIDKKRHDSLTVEEKQVYNMIDTIKNLPAVRTYVEILDIVLNGYQRFGKIDVGPYLFTYANNNIEGNRVRFGFRTNDSFSQKWLFDGYLAYGTKDRRFKYEANIDYIISRRPWTIMGIGRTDDINQVALFSDSFFNPDLGFMQNNVLFRAFANWGNIERRRPFRHEVNRFYFQTDLFKNFRQKITFSHQTFNPLFAFEYQHTNTERKQSFRTSELIFETRWAIDEQFMQRGNRRVSLGTNNNPIFTFQYTYGMNGFLGSDFGYHKFLGKITHNLRLGGLGRMEYALTGSYIPTTVPYMMLEPHLGNQSPFFNRFSYSQMNYFEFVSDKYVSLSLTHRMDGALLNRIPLIAKLKWRTLWLANILYGSLRQENKDLIPKTDLAGNPILGFNGLGKEPYVELGYGIENIFKVLRVTAFHRLTYRDMPDVSNFGVKLSVHIRL